MCYINGVKVSLETYIRYKQQQKELKQLQQALLMQPARRGFDYSEWPVIKPSIDGKDWDLVAMQWGFIPSWPSLKTKDDLQKFRNGYKDDSGKYHIGYTTLNAMGEEVFQKSMFKEAAMHRRCLIFSSGFYEHRHVIEMGKRGKPLKEPGKYPYHITVKDEPYFLMAGIYNPWTDQETGEIIDTFAIITTAANTLMSQVHNSKMRMPTILSDDLADEWTDPGLSEKRIIELATNSFPAEKMSAHSVSKDFLRNENPAEPFAYETLEALV